MRRLLLPAVALLCLALALMQAAPVSAPAQRVARDAAVASIGVYVALRSVNAALSFAQEIEVGGSVGISANAQPLKVLEPIDDTVERIAGAVFSIALVSGVLAIGIGPVSSVGFLLLAVGLAITASSGAIRRRTGVLAEPVCRAGAASNLTGLLLAVLLPASLVLGGVLGEALTRDSWKEATAQLEEVSDFSQGLLGATDEAASATADPAETEGFLDWLQSAFNEAGQGVSEFADDMEAYSEAAGFYIAHADDLLEASLTLIAIFILRTLVLPLALVAVMIALLRQVARSSA